MELQERKEIQDPKDPPEQLELLVRLGPPVLMERLAQREHLVQTVQLVLQEPLVVKVLQDLKAPPESIPLQVVMELSRLLGLPVLKDRLEKLAPPVLRALPVRRDPPVQVELARPLGQQALKVRLAKQALQD